eukprot:TRINITY_DN1458_c0_g1_i2.p1 TRINITY_DN1458_c0_g1~~TRINITY_DN1458_c0_g1_i2.p1  ORF type:complete len:840 (-),score=283.45 TRINITY_DN1458_c0_g1_i2:228-2747(-)
MEESAQRFQDFIQWKAHKILSLNSTPQKERLRVARELTQSPTVKKFIHEQNVLEKAKSEPRKRVNLKSSPKKRVNISGSPMKTLKFHSPQKKSFKSPSKTGISSFRANGSISKSTRKRPIDISPAKLPRAIQSPSKSPLKPFRVNLPSPEKLRQLSPKKSPMKLRSPLKRRISPMKSPSPRRSPKKSPQKFSKATLKSPLKRTVGGGFISDSLEQWMDDIEDEMNGSPLAKYKRMSMGETALRGRPSLSCMDRPKEGIHGVSKHVSRFGRRLSASSPLRSPGKSPEKGDYDENNDETNESKWHLSVEEQQELDEMMLREALSMENSSENRINDDETLKEDLQNGNKEDPQYIKPEITTKTTPEATKTTISVTEEISTSASSLYCETSSSSTSKAITSKESTLHNEKDNEEEISKISKIPEATDSAISEVTTEEVSTSTTISKGSLHCETSTVVTTASPPSSTTANGTNNSLYRETTPSHRETNDFNESIHCKTTVSAESPMIKQFPTTFNKNTDERTSHVLRTSPEINANSTKQEQIEASSPKIQKSPGRKRRRNESSKLEILKEEYQEFIQETSPAPINRTKPESSYKFKKPKKPSIYNGAFDHLETESVTTHMLYSSVGYEFGREEMNTVSRDISEENYWEEKTDDDDDDGLNDIDEKCHDDVLENDDKLFIKPKPIEDIGESHSPAGDFEKDVVVKEPYNMKSTNTDSITPINSVDMVLSPSTYDDGENAKYNNKPSSNLLSSSLSSESTIGDTDELTNNNNINDTPSSNNNENNHISTTTATTTTSSSNTSKSPEPDNLPADSDLSLMGTERDNFELDDIEADSDVRHNQILLQF